MNFWDMIKRLFTLNNKLIKWVDGFFWLIKKKESLFQFRALKTICHEVNAFYRQLKSKWTQKFHLQMDLWHFSLFKSHSIWNITIRVFIFIWNPLTSRTRALMSKHRKTSTNWICFSMRDNYWNNLPVLKCYARIDTHCQIRKKSILVFLF